MFMSVNDDDGGLKRDDNMIAMVVMLVSNEGVGRCGHGGAGGIHLDGE